MLTKTIYLTDQPQGHPDIKSISNEIMFSVTSFYNRPEKAENYRGIFSGQHRLAEDSGGFQFLMGKLPLSKCDPLKTVEIYKKIGVTRKDFPIQLDLPPRFSLSKEERLALIVKSAEFYHIMVEHIDWTVPVVHGWTYEELSLSLRLIEDPDRLATGSFTASATRTKNVMSCGTFKATAKGINLFDSMSNKVAAAGTFLGTRYDWVMGKLNSHEPRSRPIASGCFNVKPGYGVKSKVAVGSFNITHASTLRFTGGKYPKIVGVGANQQSGRYVLNEAGNRKGCMATPNTTAEQVVQKTPQKVVWERLALVLNMFRHRELFMLGAASPHDQHMIFLGGAKYGDTSAWRLKAYLAEIYIPENGSVAIGYKGSPRPKKEDLKILRECLRENSHPFCGMSLKRFLTIGKMNMAEWRRTWKENKWEIKPFDLRALHNAWVLKCKEESIANEFANDPDTYYHYLRHHRFKGHPNLTRKLEFLWRRFKQPYVQDTLDVFLKGQT